MSTPIDFEAILIKLAITLADDVIRAASEHSFADILADALVREPAPSEVRTAKRARLSSAPVSKSPSGGTDRLISSVVAKLRVAPTGLRAEQLRAALGVDKPTITRALRDGLAAGNVHKTGHKRSTTYFVS